MSEVRPVVESVATSVVFPSTVIGSDPTAIRDYAQAAEGLGYAGIVAYDHVLGAVRAGREHLMTGGPYDEATEFHEPLTLFAHLAAVTERIEFLTGVMVLPQRQVALVAKQAAELDLLSGGRFALGVGCGWNVPEFEALGAAFETRGAAIEEQVEVLRLLWGEQVVRFAGRFHNIDGAAIAPRPARRIPILFGGFADVAIDRAARLGDGFVFGFVSESVYAQAGALRRALAASGRLDDPFRMVAMLDYSLGPDAWGGAIEAFRAAGGTDVAVRTDDAISGFLGNPRNNFTSISEHIKALEDFAANTRPT